MTDPRASTRLIALLGNPVEHSLSPVFQNAAFRSAGVDGVYAALRCTDETFPGLLRGIARAGGAGNVTLPHKRRAAELVDRPTPAVERTGACNTFWLEDGCIHGDNTDVAGFRRALGTLVASLAGARVLLLGAGGAARGVLHTLLDADVDAVDVRNRTRDRAEALRRALDPDGERTRVMNDGAEVRGERYDIVVNATSLGLREDDRLPLDVRRAAGVGCVFDLVYRRGGTPWVRHARSLDIPALDGLEMLLHQGAAAFEHWWGVPAPLDVMRRSVAAPDDAGS